MKIVLTDKRMIAQSFVVALLFILLSIPCFGMTGKILLPIGLSFFGSVVISAVSLLVFKSCMPLGFSMIIYNLLLLAFVFVKEFVLQYEAGFVVGWIEFFYFDKLLVTGTVWFGCSLFISLKRLFAEKYVVMDFLGFFKFSSVAFIIFYSFLLLYSFVLLRLKTGDYPFRFIPLTTIREYAEQFKEIPYEVFMMFFGNLLYFTPLGFIVTSLLSSKTKLFVAALNTALPIIAFTLLEFSQYIFQNGFCEFDDMMMNTLGYWLGCLFYYIMNKFALKVSKGRFERFWN